MPPTIDLDDHRFYRLVNLSNKLAPAVLRKVIKQYCVVNDLSFQDVLNLYKHELFHYWCGATAPCCKCSGRRFNRVLLDKQWYTLFTDSSASLPASHPHAGHDCKRCPDVFDTRPGIDVDVCDVSLSSSIVTNITGKITTTHVLGLITNTNVTTSINISGLLEYTIEKLTSNIGVGIFEDFLTKYQHDLFHCMEKKRCCQCTFYPNGTNIITLAEWNMMYVMIHTPCTIAVCSHKYRPIPGITRTSLPTKLIHKIGQSVGPVVTIRSVRNQIVHAVISTMDDNMFTNSWEKLSDALGQFIDIVTDPEWREEMKSQITNLQTCAISGEMWEEYHGNLQRYLEDLDEVSQSIDLTFLQEYLQQQYVRATRCVPVIPFEEGDGLPLDQLYGAVLVEEDLASIRKTQRQDAPDDKRPLESMNDLFYTDETLLKRIIMKGEAGMGKTVFCLKLLEAWCKSSACSEATDDELEQVLSVFDLVFYVPLRLEKESSSVLDMVCQSVAGDNEQVSGRVKRMLGNHHVRCLVVLDGLDEWRVPTNYAQGFPCTQGLMNTVLFCTMRPWKLSKLSLSLLKREDKVVEILGLKPSSVGDVVRNVLVNFYGVAESSTLFKDKLKQYLRKMELPILESLMKIPMMLTALCHVWYEDESAVGTQSGKIKFCDTASYFMTYFFLLLTETMIKRAEKKHSDVTLLLQDFRINRNRARTEIKIFEGFGHLKDFQDVLEPLSKLAFNDLISDETHLVFKKYQLERDIGRSNLELALKVGLISQTKIPGRFHWQNVSVNFLHKTIQEFMAALHIIQGDMEAFALFCANCKTVDKVMDLSSVIMFVCGLDPLVGCRLTEHIYNVASRDKDILAFRKTLDGGQTKVDQLYAMQCKWFQEMECNYTYTQNKGKGLTFHVSDIYLQYKRHDSEIINTTLKLISSHNDGIVSVFLDEILGSILNILISLPQCKNLTSLHVSEIASQDTELLSDTLPHLPQLRYISYHSRTMSTSSPAEVEPPSFPGHVKSLYLRDTNLSGLALGEMGTLEKLILDNALGSLTTCLESLPLCSHLSVLHIIGIRKDYRECLADALFQLESLEDIQYHVSNYHAESDTFVVSALQSLKQLTRIDLGYIKLLCNSNDSNGHSNTISFNETHLTTLLMHNIQGSLSTIISSLLVCTNLTSVSYTHNGKDPNRQNRRCLGEVLPFLLSLECIQYHGDGRRNDDIDSKVFDAMRTLTKLRKIELWWIKQSNIIQFSHVNTSQLEQVIFFCVEMPDEAWANFVTYLLRIENSVNVEMAQTFMNTESVTRIRDSKRFVVTEADDDSLCFHTANL